MKHACAAVCLPLPLDTVVAPTPLRGLQTARIYETMTGVGIAMTELGILTDAAKAAVEDCQIKRGQRGAVGCGHAHADEQGDAGDALLPRSAPAGFAESIKDCAAANLAGTKRRANAPPEGESSFTDTENSASGGSSVSQGGHGGSKLVRPSHTAASGVPVGSPGPSAVARPVGTVGGSNCGP
jgi:hypothetical protein